MICYIRPWQYRLKVVGRIKYDINIGSKYVTWRNFPRYCRATESGFVQRNPLYLTARRRILHLSVQGHLYFCIICLFIFCYFLFFMREKIMRRAKSTKTYCFSADCLSVRPQRLSSHSRRPWPHHDAASNISWRSSPPAGNICRSYVLFLLP